MQLIFKPYSNYDHIRYVSLRIHFLSLVLLIHFMQCKTTPLEIQSTTVFQGYEREKHIHANMSHFLITTVTDTKT